jgi:hypothetical protein
VAPFCPEDAGAQNKLRHAQIGVLTEDYVPHGLFRLLTARISDNHEALPKICAITGNWYRRLMLEWGVGRLLRISKTTSLSRPSAQYDARIDASETETVRYRMRDRHVPDFAAD